LTVGTPSLCGDGNRPDVANELRARPLVAGSGRGRLSTMRFITIVEVIRMMPGGLATS
jgi:hypothetical protein